MYSLLLALIYIAFISLGLPDSLLGSGWPAMHADMNIPISFMGIISMVISGGTILSSMLSDMLTRKFGTHIVTIVSVFLTVIAMFGFSFSTELWMLIVLSIPYGLGAGAIDAALNNYVAVHYASKHMSWLHCFWGVGTIISPFIMGYALTNSTWHDGYRIVALIQLGIGLLLLVSLPVWKLNQKSTEGNSKGPGLIGALKIKGVPSLLIGFFAFCSAESTAMYWASTYLVEVKGISTDLAARLGSLFYIGLTVGRFLGGFMMDKLGDRRMIILGTCILSGGIISLLIPTPNPMVSFIGFIIVGFGCAPIYPCIIHSAPDNFGAENSGTIIGIQMASAYAGTTFMPPLFGLIGNSIGFEFLPLYLIVFVILTISMTELTFRITKRKKN